MKKTIELLEQAQNRLQQMLLDFRLITSKNDEIATILGKYLGNQIQSEFPDIDLSKLSNRESEVFQKIGENLSGLEIAQKLQISIKTFNIHRDNIRKKLKINSAHELKELAIKLHKSTSTNI